VDILARAPKSLGHLAAELFELLGCVLNDVLLAVSQVLRRLAETLAAHAAGAVHGLGTRVAEPVSGVGGSLTPALSGIAGCTTAGLDCLSGLTCGILLSVISHVILPLRQWFEVLLSCCFTAGAAAHTTPVCCGAQMTNSRRGSAVPGSRTGVAEGNAAIVLCVSF
jgi:hypothetical protein